MQLQQTFQHILKDYPFLIKGLNKLGITIPLDLQQQLLLIQNQIQNLILCAPAGCGKKIGLLILSLRKFVNQQQGILVLIAHSKDLSQQLSYQTSVLSKIPIINLFMQKQQQSSKKCIIIGSPIQISQLSEQKKTQILTVVIFQSDFLFGFGYGRYLQKLGKELNNVIYQIDCIKIGNQLESFKLLFMKKITKIMYQPPSIVEQNKIKLKLQTKFDTKLIHFYLIANKQLIPISLYVSLKFQLVNQKILIIVQNIKQVYKYYLFLDRVKIQNIGLYNYLNPIDLKFYTLSLWINGNVNILVASKQLYQDINNNIFKQNCKKMNKQMLQFNSLATVICINLTHVEKIFQDIFNSFSCKPFIMTLLQNNQKQKHALQNLIKYENTIFSQVKSKQFPIPKPQLQSFTYRINDVWMSLGSNKIKQFQKYDFLKKLLKSSDLNQFYQNNVKAKNYLISSIQSIKNQINTSTVSLSIHVPIYLVPQCLKKSYAQQIQLLHKQQQKQQYPNYIKKIHKTLEHIDLQQQNPQNIDISRLPLISSRKRWKIEHGFKLKKKNIYKERKGIFNNN